MDIVCCTSDEAHSSTSRSRAAEGEAAGDAHQEQQCHILSNKPPYEKITPSNGGFTIDIKIPHYEENKDGDDDEDQYPPEWISFGTD